MQIHKSGQDGLFNHISYFMKHICCRIALLEIGKRTPTKCVFFFRNTMCKNNYVHTASLGGSVGCTFDWWSGGCRFDPCQVGNILSWRVDREIFSKVILSLP